MGPWFRGDRQEVRTFLSFDIVHIDEIFVFVVSFKLVMIKVISVSFHVRECFST